MKTLVKTLFFSASLIVAFVAILILTAQAARAESPVNAQSAESKVASAPYQSALYVSKGGQVVNILLDKAAGQSVMIQLKAEDGDVLAQRTLGKSAVKYHQKFDLSELPDGTYQVEIRSGGIVKSHTVTLTTPTVSRQISLR